MLSPATKSQTGNVDYQTLGLCCLPSRKHSNISVFHCAAAHQELWTAPMFQRWLPAFWVFFRTLIIYSLRHVFWLVEGHLSFIHFTDGSGGSSDPQACVLSSGTEWLCWEHPSVSPGWSTHTEGVELSLRLWVSFFGLSVCARTHTHSQWLKVINKVKIFANFLHHFTKYDQSKTLWFTLFSCILFYYRT